MTNRDEKPRSETASHGLDRRDFMRAGAATVGALGLAGLLDLAGADSLFDTDDGGFYIRYHDADDPPYEVSAEYTRADGSNTSFTRDLSGNATRSENATANLQHVRGGSDRLASAFSAAAALYMFDNSMYEWTGTQRVAPGAPAPTGR